MTILSGQSSLSTSIKSIRRETMYETNSEREGFFYTSQVKQALYEAHDITMPVLDADTEYLGEDDVDVLDLLVRASCRTIDNYDNYN